MTTKPLLSRKDIATMIGLCCRTIKRKEKVWGLDKARADMASRAIFYNGPKVVLILSRHGLL